MADSTRSKQEDQPAVLQNSSISKLSNLLNNSSELSKTIESYHENVRNREYTPTLTLAMFVSQVLSEDSSCQSIVNQTNIERFDNNLPVLSSHTGAYTKARQRLSLEMIKKLTQESGRLISKNSPEEWLWKGRRVKLVDGTTILMPDTKDNQLHYPQHGGQEEGVGFPIARLVGITCCSTGSLLDVNIGSYKGKGTGEHSLLRGILDNFETGDVVLADAYYSSYFLVAELINRGVDVLFEQNGARITDFRKGQKLGERDHIVDWTKPQRPDWMTPEEYKNYPDEIKIREIMLGYNLIRMLMSESAIYSGLLPRKISFKHTLQIWLAWRKVFNEIFPRYEDIELLLCMIAQKKVGKRPGRIEPREVKRRPKPFKKLQKPREIQRKKIRKFGHGKKAA